MRKSMIGVAALVALLAWPAVAVGGVLPPENADWQDGENVASTPLDTDLNDVAEVVFLGVFITKCGSVAPFDLDGSQAISSTGEYGFSGKVANLAGQRFKLKIKGEFVSPTKVVEKVTIKKGKCKKTKTFTLQAF